METAETDEGTAADITGINDLEANQDKTFADFDVEPEIVAALRDQGIIHPFPIQALTLPVALNRQDIIGQAKTGTGKTLGFAIPILHDIIGPGDEGWDEIPDSGFPQALVILPTRELAKQVAAEIRAAATHRVARIIEIYGGVGFDSQVEALRKGVEVVVGTPGRLIDLMNQGTLKLGRIRTLVMDEADEMLDMGFLPDVEKLISQIPPRRHTMLFSATMPGPVVALARRYMYQPTHIRATDPTDSSQTVRQVKQVVYRVHSLNKTEVIARILQARNRGLTIIFTRTKRTCQRLSDELAERGFATGAIHGDLGQNARERALRAFRHGKVDVLVATDVAARGIDVDDVTHVINYECPEDDKTYIHRIGRTARAGNKGSAITFIDWEDLTRWRVINRTLDLDFADPQETYHTSPHLYSDLDIPTDATANLPRFRRVRAGLEAEELEDLGGRDPARPGKRRAGKGSGAGRRKSEKGRGPRKNTKKKHDCKEREKTTKRGAAEEPAKKERQRKRTRRHKSDKTGKGKGAH
ncbi:MULTISPECIES: DEAD/DEAH box helicase [Mobiluncus]|uniref:RNA helicase n=2 Tax=Mobiluncus TaxID=2050 RepID=E6M231_9ACTO|nr:MULTISPECIES: DEAD/DEAH box helicase [Mobiluncus]EFL92970.1 DEAD/DEAH box helicase [Mobiluncus curtisii subsp. curtisii ATCC 35241]EFU82544.1 DEAD/DEAH box helicase [Mobiluncus holmesii ATCC 35242]MCU9987020.1 DEAD/DEAH box helicase [Mobiluncus curtisii]MCU9999920.1 DEAD/DEAH box helicase [Mobiluncus curtisii]NMW44855.1 DEAD/DEAH box helicase [Mobiluncus curtisii]